MALVLLDESDQIFDTYAIWTPVYNSRVIAVARVKMVKKEAFIPGAYRGDWRVYIGVVDGFSHEYEWRDVLRIGDKVPKDFAEFLFKSQIDALLALDNYKHITGDEKEFPYAL